MHVSIIVPMGEIVVSSVVGAFKLFHSVNTYLKQTGQRTDDFYHIDLVGLEGENAYYHGLFDVNPNKLIGDVKQTDLVIVSTVRGDFEQAININEAFIPWIRDQRIQHGAEVASLCGGAFLLAATGLLNGKRASTHWTAHDAFRARFPQVELVPEKIIVDEDGIYTSGGAYSFLNLLLHLVQKYNGRETAIWCAKMFEIEFDRSSQSPFIIFQGQKDHADETIREAQDYIEANYHDKLSIDSLSERFATSRRNFVRRFKKATANTPLEYIQRVKIEAAKKQLESSTRNISEVMYDVGYNDQKAFRNIFRKVTGLSPHAYRMKYNREMALVNSN